MTCHNSDLNPQGSQHMRMFMQHLLHAAHLHATSFCRLSGAGFDRASENLWAACCGHTANRGPAPPACLKILQMCKNAEGCPLPYVSRQGRGAQPPGDPKGLLNHGLESLVLALAIFHRRSAVPAACQSAVRMPGHLTYTAKMKAKAELTACQQ